MPLLSRDEILKADDLPHEDVPVPEWGGAVRVRTLPATERDAFESAVAAGRRNGRFMPNFRARLASLAVVGEDGKPLFSEEDVASLGRKSGKALDRVADAAMRLAGLSEEGQKEAEGNSAAVPS